MRDGAVGNIGLISGVCIPPSSLRVGADGSPYIGTNERAGARGNCKFLKASDSSAWASKKFREPCSDSSDAGSRFGLMTYRCGNPTTIQQGRADALRTAPREPRQGLTLPRNIFSSQDYTTQRVTSELKNCYRLRLGSRRVYTPRGERAVHLDRMPHVYGAMRGLRRSLAKVK